MSRRERLFVRIPLIFEAAAEGRFAVAALLGVVLLLVGLKLIELWL